MERKLTKKQFDKIAEKNSYWNNRWSYIRKVLDLYEGEKEVLEIGNNGIHLIQGSDTLDINPPATYIQDASLNWNLPKKYDLIIGLQVFEHLDNPKKAFKQAKRYGRKIILSFPIEWDTPTDLLHNNVTRAEIIRWTQVPKTEIRINGQNGRDRLICIY